MVGDLLDRIIKKLNVRKLRFPVECYQFDVQVVTSIDEGKSFWYAGAGRFCKDEADVQKTVKDYIEKFEKDGEEYAGCTYL